MKAPGTGSSPGKQQEAQQDGKDPLAGSRSATTQREQAPDKPGSKPGEQPGATGDPQGNQQTHGDPVNSAGKTPPAHETERVAHAPDAREAWGYLPEQVRDVFRTQGGGQMPARYREWIDAYYKKLNQKP